MAKYNDAKCRLCRREGTKLLLKGDRCFTDKCAFDRRPYAPGQHGRARKKLSDYAVQLREKQKVAFMAFWKSSSTVTSSTPIWRRA